ncbi:MAG: GNAT family N-acetyltransferase [Terriglobales bacterium]
MMAEVLDLRQFRPAQLEPLLAAEAEEWLRELHWDYRSSLALIRQYIGARVLPGYVLAEGTPREPRPRGYGFFVYEAQKGLIGDLFVHPASPGDRQAQERLLLEHMIETLQATPGLRRIEAQLMPYRPPDLAASFAQRSFRAFRRLFLFLDLRAPSAGGDGAAADGAGRAIEPWQPGLAEPAAALIQHAYEGHIDSLINDQYRSQSGSMRFLHNVVNYPGCGEFDAGASGVVRGPAGGVAALLLASRVQADVAHVTQVCVAPSARQRGLARRLFVHALADLRARGFRAVTLTVTAANTSALALYRQLGFTTLREFDAYVWEP